MRSPVRLAAACLAVCLATAATADAQDATAGEAVFKHNCTACHSPLPGKNIVGPSLFGIIGREAGTAPNFKYSNANKTSGITWDEAKLDPYLTNPRAVVPGTIMTFPGLKDPQQRADVIAYLETLR
jgi:cytochrome c